MYHSHLLINTGNNPDRPDWGVTRRWLRNLYRVHQRLCMAFPSKASASQPERVATYCAPSQPAGLNELRELPDEPDTADVHHQRSDKAGLLFRIDHPVCEVVNGKASRSDYGHRRPVIIVQSASDDEPDWNYAFGLDEDATDERGRPIGNAAFLLAAPPQTRKVSIDLDGEALVLASSKESHRIVSGDIVRFRLRANPTRKAQDGSRNGKRRRVNPEFADHAQWLARKLAGAADPPICIDTFVPGWAHGWRTKHEPQPKQRMQWWSVLFEGSFRVGDVNTLKSLLETGIGSAKSFGFGLLSLAPPG